MTRGVGTGWFRELECVEDAREALLFEGRSTCYADLSREVGAMIAELSVHAIVRGTRVGLLAPPSEAGVALIHAMLDTGIVMVPLNLRWTQSELHFAAVAAQLAWIVVSDSTEDRGAAVAEDSGCGVVRLATTTHAPMHAMPIESTNRAGSLELIRSPAPADSVSQVRHAHPADGEDASSAEEATALILFTSGTSGRPKGAMLTLDNLRASAEGSIALLGSEPDDRWLCCMPLFHIGGLSILIRSVLAGTAVALHSQFDAEAVDAALDRDRITRVSLVAAMLGRLLEVRGPRRAPETLRLVLLGGGPATQELLVRAELLGYPVAPTYGLTEAASQVATRPPANRPVTELDDGSAADLAAGLMPLPGIEIRVVDDRETCIDAGRVGEIQVRGPSVMRGYLDDPEATARALQKGWFSTGDLGRLDANGRLRVIDRRSDLIVSGGENVYPAEVESTLCLHPSIAEAGVIGVEDSVYGARPCAFLVAAPGQSIDTSAIREFCRERLAGYKVPNGWVVLEALPRTASGKLLRRDLEEHLRLPDPSHRD